jgi:hypothetical protein
VIKLAAKYAKKYAEFKAIAGDFKRTDEERAAARLGLQKLPRNAIQPASVTVAPSLVVLVERSSTLAWRAPRFVKWLCWGNSWHRQGQLVSDRRTKHEHE